MYDPYPNSFPNSGVYGERPNPMGRPMEYASKPQMRGHQMPFHQPPQTDADYHRSGAIVSASTSSSSSNSIFPRSASEALFDNTSKFRQLPCRTFISVGTCPYRERCVYLHDPRCICKEAKTKTRRKNKEDVVLDALFWPVMPYPMVAAKLDMNRQPHVIQPYSVPLPQADQYQKHDATVYSMWMHFVDFCLATSDSNNARHADSAPCFAAPNVPINSYTGEARLKFFQFLSSCNGRVVSREELMRCTGTPVPLPHGAPRQAHAAPRRVSDEASHPYFTSSAPPLAEVQQQQAMRQHRSLPGERDGYAPAAQQQQQSVLYARTAPATNPNVGFVNPGLQVNTNANAGIQGYNDPRLNHASGQSISPVSYEQRSPHVNYGSASTTQQALLQTQSRTINGGSTSALYGPSGSLSSSTSAATSPTVKPDAPTTLSVLMNTVPQSQLSALNGTQLGSMQILGAAQADPWLVDACGLTDTEEDRDSGSSYNSAPVKQFRSVWNEASEDAAALSFNMLNGLI